MRVPSEEAKTVLETDGVGVGVGIGVGVGVVEVVKGLPDVEIVDEVLIVSVGDIRNLGETYEEEVIFTEEAEAEGVVEPVELEDECVRGVLDVVVEEGSDDGKMGVGTSLMTLVIPPTIPLRPTAFPVPCEDAEDVVLWLTELGVELLLKGSESWAVTVSLIGR